MPSKLHVVIASTRPGRQGPAVARWFESYAREHGAFEPTLVDLADFELPVYDEPKHPRMQQYAHEHTKRWAETVASADAYAFVTPEYNFGPPPSLLNALNYVYLEWNYKVAGVVSYGGVSGGLRSAQLVKQTLAALRMATPPEGVPIPSFTNFIKDGVFEANDLIVASAKTMLDEMAKWERGLSTIRAS